ncbi:GumC family protein [Lyngbya aestuarii]|uniref:GumC family protein n=1 Tax=Lyngbya aestuarii TaxID=118322 RepID=UPI00403D9CB1
MTSIPRASTSFTRESINKTHWSIYLLAVLAANSTLWISAWLYLKLIPPTYTSEWLVSLREVTSYTDIKLPELGGASSSVKSPFESRTQDPRESYKLIAASEPVLEAAKTQVGLEKFRKPRIELVDSTTLMQFQITGDSPEEAQEKAFALEQALVARLDELKMEESALQKAETQSVLESSQRKLEAAQKRISDYKARSGLMDRVQISELSQSIEYLRRLYLETNAEQGQVNSRYRELSASLDKSPSQAFEAFTLQNDRQFQKHDKDHSDANAALAILRSRYGPNHPAVVREQGKLDAANSAMLVRSQQLLGRPTNSAILDQLNIDNKDDLEVSVQNKLAEGLIEAGVRRTELKAKAQSMEQNLGDLENKLQILGKHEANLEALRRDLQIAEAVFSSTLAKLDIGTSEIQSSYPPIQVVTTPSLPKSPSAPKKSLVLLGTLIGSFFITTGIGSLWLRKQLGKRQQTKQKISQKPELGKSAPLKLI